MRRGAGEGCTIGRAVEGDEKGGKNVSRRIIKSDERRGAARKNRRPGRLQGREGGGQGSRERCWRPSLDLDCRSLKVPVGGASRLSVR